ncbi:selenium cofactor biosynthesis protein YqeC [Halosimplex sp. J119]
MPLAAALGLGDRELVVFVGAGGKKTAMRRLTATGDDRGLDVGYTTTTAMPPPPDIPMTLQTRSGHPFVISDRDPPLAFADEWVNDPDRADRKVTGPDPSFVRAVYLGGVFDWVLVKGDGARRREFKAPGEGEPVIPAVATHVVPVVSVRVVGEPLAEGVVHRPERVAALCDLSVGDDVTPSAVAAVLAHENGALKNVPPGATVTPLVNKADTADLRETAWSVLTEAFRRTSRYSRGVVASLEADRCDVVEASAGTD